MAEAEKLLADYPDKWPRRFCWKCNKNHAFLKASGFPNWCIGCNHMFYKGVDCGLKLM